VQVVISGFANRLRNPNKNLPDRRKPLRCSVKALQ
jgi:hypothetical protein